MSIPITHAARGLGGLPSQLHRPFLLAGTGHHVVPSGAASRIAAARSVATSSKQAKPPAAQARPVGASIDLPPAPLNVPKAVVPGQPHPVWQRDPQTDGWMRSPSPAEKTQFMQSEVENGCLDFAISYEFTVNQHVTPQDLVHAWTDTLFRLPIVGVEKKGDWTNGFWYYPDYSKPENLSDWLTDTFVYLPSGGRKAIQEAIDVQLSHAFSHKHTAHCTISPAADGHFSVALYCRHSAYDLQGTSVVFGAFEAALADILSGQLSKRQWGNEISRLPIPTEQAVRDDIGHFTPEQVAEGTQLMKEQMEMVNKPHFNLPYAQAPNWSAVSNGASSRARVTLSTRETSDMVKAVKKAKLSVTPFILACAMQALKKYSPPADQHVFLNVIDRRRWLHDHHRAPHSSETWPFFGNVVHVLHAPDRGNDVLALAREVYKRQWEDLTSERPVPLWGLDHAQQDYNNSLVPFNPNQPPNYETGTVYVSSPGPLDKGKSAPLPSSIKRGLVLIENIDLGVNIRMTSAHSLLHIWTMGGKCQLQTTIPKWYDPELAQSWMEDTKKLMNATAASIHSGAAKL